MRLENVGSRGTCNGAAALKRMQKQYLVPHKTQKSGYCVANTVSNADAYVENVEVQIWARLVSDDQRGQDHAATEAVCRDSSNISDPIP